MDIGVPEEIKDGENRVGMTPDGVETLVEDGHNVLIEEGAGAGAGYTDEAYEQAGADIVDADEAWDTDLTVKVKEPLEDEYEYLDDDTTLFTYLHLAADEDLTEELLESETTAIGYETVEEDGELPLLEPMSQVAGRMASIMGATYQSSHEGGGGVLPPGIPGVEAADVTVIGGGTVGENAAEVSAGMGADVTVLDIDQQRLDEIERYIPDNVDTRTSNRHTIQDQLEETDILIGSVLVKGAEAPTVVEEDDLELMDDGSVIVDVAVDQGGCIETTEPTSHSDPVYTEKGIVHYAVTNMPAAYPQTATEGLTDRTLPYIREIAEKGWKEAMAEDDSLLDGLNTAEGEITYENVAETFDMDYTDPTDLYDELS